MDKKEPINKLQEIVNILKTNSKDIKLTEKLLADYKFAIAESLHEPAYVDIKKRNVVKKKSGSTYEMAICEDGTAVYKVYGGYTVVVQPKLQALAGLIEEYIDVDDSELSDIDKETLETDLSAFAYVMSAPIFACSDFGLKYDLASMIVKKMQEVYDEAMQQELKEDTKEDSLKNAEFEDAILGVEEVKRELDLEDGEVKGKTKRHD